MNFSNESQLGYHVYIHTYMSYRSTQTAYVLTHTDAEINGLQV